MSISTRRRITGALVTTALLSLGLAVPSASAATVSLLADFESSTDAPEGFYSYSGDGGGAGYGVQTVQVGEPRARDGQTAPNNVLSVGVNVPSGYAGFGQNFTSAQDFSDFDGFQFWMFGANSGAVFQSELLDGSAPGADSTTAERFDVQIVDDWTGWRLVQLPFAGYQASTDFQPNPDDGVLDTDALVGFIFPVVSGTAEWAFDDIGVFADADIAPTVGFAAARRASRRATTASLVGPPQRRVDQTRHGRLRHGRRHRRGRRRLHRATRHADLRPGRDRADRRGADDAGRRGRGQRDRHRPAVSPRGRHAGHGARNVLTIRDDDAAEAQPVWDNVRIIDDFSYTGGVPTGEDADGNAVGFETFTDPSASSAVSLAVPPSAIPGHEADDQALRVDLRAPSYAGFTSKLTDDALSAWVPQDWSTFDGISFWLLGPEHRQHPVRRHPGQPQPGFDDGRRRPVQHHVRRRLPGLAVRVAAVHLVPAQGRRQRRPERRPDPDRDARLGAGRGVRTDREQLVPRRRGAHRPGDRDRRVRGEPAPHRHRHQRARPGLRDVRRRRWLGRDRRH